MSKVRLRSISIHTHKKKIYIKSKVTKKVEMMWRLFEMNDGDENSTLEEYAAEDIDELIEEYRFYELPTSIILRIIKKSKIRDVALICELVSRMVKSKGEESILLLNVIDRRRTKLDDCIKIISQFNNCPLCKLMGELYMDFKGLPERDYEADIAELKKEIEKLQINAGFPPVKSRPDDFESNICFAAYQGKLSSVQYLVERCHVNVEKMDKDGRTPINNAAEKGHLDVVRYLNEICHANVETKDIDGFTPMNNASLFGHLDVVKYLYEKCHANVEAKDNRGCTPISNASSNGDLNIVKYLYETCHADVEKVDNDGCTPLNNASSSCHLDVVKYLYEKCHANVEAKDKDGNTPISNASLNGHLEVVKYLFKTCHASITDEIVKKSSLNCRKYFHY